MHHLEKTSLRASFSFIRVTEESHNTGLPAFIVLAPFISQVNCDSLHVETSGQLCLTSLRLNLKINFGHKTIILNFRLKVIKSIYREVAKKFFLLYKKQSTVLLICKNPAALSHEH